MKPLKKNPKNLDIAGFKFRANPDVIWVASKNPLKDDEEYFSYKSSDFEDGLELWFKKDGSQVNLYYSDLIFNMSNRGAKKLPKYLQKITGETEWSPKVSKYVVTKFKKELSKLPVKVYVQKI